MRLKGPHGKLIRSRLAPRNIEFTLQYRPEIKKQVPYSLYRCIDEDQTDQKKFQEVLTKIGEMKVLATTRDEYKRKEQQLQSDDEEEAYDLYSY